jgi:hypothetical protein
VALVHDTLALVPLDPTGQPERRRTFVAEIASSNGHARCFELLPLPGLEIA